MSGAVGFHLFTPLGIDPNNDGGGLFVMAVTVWIGSLLLLIVRHKTLFAILGGLRAAILPEKVPANPIAKTRIHPV